MGREHERDNGFPSPRLTRALLILLVPLTVLGAIQAISWAAAAIKTWTAGERLTAADLNSNFNAVNTAIDNLQGTGKAHLRGTRPLSLVGTATKVDVPLGSGWTSITETIYDPIDGNFAPPAGVPNSTRHYRLVIRSGNNCVPPGAVVQYRLYFGRTPDGSGWNNRADDRVYPGASYWGETYEGGWEIIDLDHIADPQGGFRPGFWHLEANVTGTPACTHEVKNVTLEIWDVMN